MGTELKKLTMLDGLEQRETELLADVACSESIGQLNHLLQELSKPPLNGVHLNDSGNTEQLVTIAVLGPPLESMPICLQGAQQSRGNILMVLEPSWLERRQVNHNEEGNPVNTQRLFIRRAVSFDGGGVALLEDFVPPRKVTYLAKLSHVDRVGLENAYASLLAPGLECALGPCHALNKLTSNTLHWHSLLTRDSELANPRSITFATARCAEAQKVASETSAQGCQSASCTLPLLEPKVDLSPINVQQSRQMRNSSRRRYRARGGRAPDRQHPSFLQTAERCAGGQEQRRGLEQGCYVPPETRLSWWRSLCRAFSRSFRNLTRCRRRTPPGWTPLRGPDCLKLWRHSERTGWTAALRRARLRRSGRSDVENARELPVERLGFKVRALVARAPWGEPEIVALLAVSGSLARPIRFRGSSAVDLDAVLQAWGASDAAREDIRTAVSSTAERLARLILDSETSLKDVQKGGAGCQTDFLGVDMLVAPAAAAHQAVRVFVIKVLPDWRCCRNLLTPSVSLSKSASLWVANMVSRSQDCLLRGKRILILGAGGYTKRFIWEHTRKLGLRVVLAHEDASHFARELVETFIVVPGMEFHSPELDRQHAARIVEALEERRLTVDGCLTVWEEHGPLAGLVNNLLGTRGNSYEAQALAKSKFRTLEALMRATGERPYGPPTSAFASKIYRLPDEAALVRAWEDLEGRPAMLKPEHGSASTGVYLAKTLEEARAKYKEIPLSLTGSPIGRAFGCDLLLMEYIEGPSHEVGIIMFDGQLVAALLYDVGPCRKPYFNETSAACPSGLQDGVQESLRQAAARICRALGLNHGVFSVELKSTRTGLKLIEVNGRQGGYYIQDWMRRVYGVDLLKANMLTAFGIRPHIHTLPQPRTHLVGRMIYSGLHGAAFGNGSCSVELLTRLHREGVADLFQQDPDLVPSEEFEEPFANIAVPGATRAAAKAHMEALWRMLGFEALDSKPCPYYLSLF
ncbi:carnosine synthase [Klebsormidium nitens]|uniref:Carnosine synthase n=1 Tax=Klebsormidium nitens TaxID=105231 RepID=A0A1Y1I9L7_KLENI|nr:carnosine synthase [Klebsormidium nitens]|eukprot:GAQ84768.1 carnosine synthase [Klebsormidium nitens]